MTKRHSRLLARKRKRLPHIDLAPGAAGANSLHMPAPGEEVPDFSFTNQSGKHISLKQYRGNVLLVTFIYTRCPFPDFCPRVSSNFAEIYKQLGTNPALAGTHLLSISFDPEHDTPKVLRDYGFSVAHTHEPALFTRWEFAAPSAADLPRIADFFALTIKPEGGLITHNLSTAVIGPDGKIVKWYHGSDWQASDLIKDAAAIATRASSRKNSSGHERQGDFCRAVRLKRIRALAPRSAEHPGDKTVCRPSKEENS